MSNKHQLKRAARIARQHTFGFINDRPSDEELAQRAIRRAQLPECKPLRNPQLAPFMVTKRVLRQRPPKPLAAAEVVTEHSIPEHEFRSAFEDAVTTRRTGFTLETLLAALAAPHNGVPSRNKQLGWLRVLGK